MDTDTMDTTTLLKTLGSLQEKSASSWSGLATEFDLTNRYDFFIRYLPVSGQGPRIQDSLL